MYFCFSFSPLALSRCRSFLKKSLKESPAGGGRLGSDVVNEDGDGEGGHQEYAEDADQEEDRVEDTEATAGGFPTLAPDLLGLCKGLDS